jgi:hypothetical protein
MADLGWNPVARCLVLLQLAALVTTVALYRATGLTLSWDADSYVWCLVLTGLGIAWLYFVWEPGSSREWLYAEVVLVVLLFFSLALIVPPAQYAAVAVTRPLIDPWLAAMDARLGIHVPAIVAWTGTHPLLVRLLVRAYLSLLPQFLLPLVLLPMTRDREALWEYIFHFEFCSIVTLAALAVWPVAHAFTFYGFRPLLSQDRLIYHIAALRDGTLTTVRLDDLQGLVSFPSFHVAGAVIVTWVCRRSWLWVPLALINVLLSAATVMLGLHYATDLLGTAVMCGTSLWLYRRWAAPLLQGPGKQRTATAAGV